MTFRFLVSFHYHAKTDLQAIADAYNGPVEVFADSGAYSAATLGVTINRADYAAWLRDWSGLFTTTATLDVIGDPDATHRNTLALQDAGLRVLPVFHTGSSWDRLEALCKEYSYVALGGMVPYSNRPDEVMRWLIRCFKVAREYGTVFHGFGQTRIGTMADLPFYSVDSSSWGAGSRWGELRLWDERRRKIIIVQTGDPVEARKYATLLRLHGANPAITGRPGFALRSQRGVEQHRKEDILMVGVSAVSFYRVGEWLTRRHKVPPPSSHPLSTPGTAVYLAASDDSRMGIAARAIAAITKDPL